jgi:tetratricopeptide (TPR) repeat protein
MLNAIGLKISRYTAAVFSIPIFPRAIAGLGLVACAACGTVTPRSDQVDAPQAFYTVTGEIALSRHEPRVAALQYVAAAEGDRDVGLLERAAAVTTDCLQPSLTRVVAARWIEVDPASLEAHRAAGRAALSLQRIGPAAEHYRFVIAASPLGVDPEIDSIEHELAASDNAYGARQLADRLTSYFPSSGAARRMQAYAALRADDPEAAVASLRAALTLPVPDELRAELNQALQRARILAGDQAGPLADAREALRADASSANRLDYAVLLMAAQLRSEARQQLGELLDDRAAAPAALRFLGLLDFEDGKLDDAGRRFAALLSSGKFVDDAVYYLAVIAERRGDPSSALRLYAQVQGGDNVVQALMRAAAILRAGGAKPQAEELLDRLIEEEPARAPEILASRARIYSQSGDFARAGGVLDAGLLQYPDKVELRYARASLYEEQGQVPRALRELRAVLKSRPDDPTAINAYGYTLADHNQQLSRARELIEQAHAVAPKNAAILDSLGWVMYRQGQREQALSYLHQAYTEDRSADMAAHLGEVLWQIGRRSEAQQVWSEGERVDADNTLLKATRERLHAAN